jgi:PAS domain S-box-containing protein
MPIDQTRHEGLKADKYTLDQQGVGWHFWRYSFWIVILLTSSLILVSAWFVDRNNNDAYVQKARSQVQNQLNTIRARLEGHLNSNIQAVNGLVAAISIEPNLTQERFALYAKPLIDSGNQLRNIGAAPDMVLQLIYPLENNRGALGLNYLTHEKQRQGAITARDSGQLVLAGPIDLVQGGRGFIGRIPVYSEHIVKGERRFWGLISAVIDADSLYKESGLYDEDLALDVAIFGHDKRFSDGTIFYGNEDIFTQHPVVAFIELPFGKWQLAALPSSGWPQLADDAWRLRFTMLIVALCILTPVVTLAWLNNRHRDQQIRLNALFQLSPMGIALNDFETGEYLKVNKRLIEDTGYTLKELRQLSYWDITPEKYKEQEAQQLHELTTKGTYGPYEKEYINNQGITYPVLLNGVLIEDSQGRKLIWSYIENISLQKKAEKELLEHNKQFELVINATQVGIWDWQVETGALTLNDRWAEIIGYTLNELGDISIETWLSHAHPDDLEESGNRLQAHWDGKSESYIFEGRMRHKDGHDVWVLDTGKVIEWSEQGKPKRMVGTHLDITDKKQSEQKIAQTNASLAKQIKLIKAVATTQSDFIQNRELKDPLKNVLKQFIHLTESELAFIGNVFYQDNQASIEMLTFDSIETNTIHDDIHTQFSLEGMRFTNPDNLFVQAANSQTALFLNHRELSDSSIKLPNNHPNIKNFLGIPIVQNGRCIGFIGLANRESGYDINIVNWLEPLTNTVGQLIERMAAIEEKRKTDQQLIEAKNDAEAADRAKTEFLATMSHEIRTPMNGVLGMLGLLKKSKLTQEQSRKVEIAKVSADSLLSIINDILDFSKVESGKLELENISFNIRELIDNICQSMALRTQDKQVELISDLSGLHINHIISDPVRIRQILTNLIGNADKFTNQGEITIKASIETTHEQAVFHCEICDTGVGIPKDKIGKLFQSFSQVDASTTRKFGGTGLGLSICKRICELMGGSISVDSQENVGSCFRFEIPIILDQEQADEYDTRHLDALSILVVDNNVQACQAISNQLTAWGNTPNLANTSQEALSLINDHEFDLILIDSYLDDMNGIELGQLIRKDHPNLDTRLILMTRINQAESDNEIRQAGFNSHFAKPVTSYDLSMSFKSLEHHTTHAFTLDPRTLTTMQLPTNTKILLVEDIAFNQEVALMLLQEMNLKADLANNGEEAVNAVKAALKDNAAYDLILMDCQMPIMDGFDATRAIRELENHTDHKSLIIAMTANAMSTDKEKCLAAGMDDYLSKPVDEAQLQQTLSKWLKP